VLVYRQVFIEIIPKSGLYFHDALANTVEKSVFSDFLIEPELIDRRAKMSFFWTVDTGVTLNRYT
jgi:hypothetical protein